jgi:hypothetical protein
MKSKSEIVYVYNYKDLILITRDRNGEWFYRYNLLRILKHLQKINPNEEKYKGYDKLFEVGCTFQAKIAELLKYCKKSYGDEK